MPARSVLDEYRTRYRTAIEREGNEAEIARGNLRAFDPRQYAAESTQATTQLMKRDLTRGLDDLRGQQVGMGRLRTGFGFGDEDRLWEGYLDRVALNNSANAMQAAGLQFGKLSTDYSSVDRYGDWLASGYDLELARKNAEDQKKRNKGGLFGGILGGIAGAFIPGVGPLIGGMAGSAIGGALA